MLVSINIVISNMKFFCICYSLSILYQRTLLPSTYFLTMFQKDTDLINKTLVLEQLLQQQAS